MTDPVSEALKAQSEIQLTEVFGLNRIADEITEKSFGESEKLRQAGLIPGNIIAKISVNKPLFRKYIFDELAKLQRMILDYKKKKSEPIRKPTKDEK